MFADINFLWSMENQPLFNTLLSDYQVRKSGKQKDRFIRFVHETCFFSGWSSIVEEKKGLIRNRNIVVGDVDKADVILTAHYDTCAWIPFPNFITPKNIFFYLLYQLLIVGILGAVSYGITSLAALITGKTFLFLTADLIFLALVMLLIVGIPNKHTANDNTSGVATLLALIQNMPTSARNKVAFVFFDNEEIGLVGSSRFKTLHKNVISEKLLINFDCVSDGDYFLVVSKKRAFGSEEFPVLKKIMEDEAAAFDRKPEFSTAVRAFYPSDQILFPKSIAVASLKKSPILGLYMDRIHTSRDTCFDTNNLAYLTRCFTKFVLQIQGSPPNL